MSDDSRYQRFNLRLPKDLMAKIQEAADSHSRSANAEIIARLTYSFDNPQMPEEMLVKWGDMLEALERLTGTINAQAELKEMRDAFEGKDSAPPKT